ncbi:MAG: DUF4157 domain-containing protein [Acidobacteria bacterium]|nr:DUF4157 domain-containing protein [Acidobacteriota bacterium]
MKSQIQKTLTITMVGILLGLQAHASDLSDALGINIDPSAGKFEVGPPNPGPVIQRLPQIIQRLPQDIANLGNPAGLALAAAVRHAEAQASYGARPIPPAVYQQLQGYFAPNFLQGVRYNTFDNARISLDSAVMMLNNDVAAITLNNIVVFRNENEAQNAYTWAHELTHVLQYQNLGIDAFANMYTTNAWVLENQAKDNAARFGQVQAGAQGQQQQQQFAYFNVTGQFLYGDANGNLYPANPNNGQVVGPANGRVVFQNGQYWAIDSFGRTWLATRIR